MKNYILLLALLCIVIVSEAQEAKVEKSTFGIQTGVLGFWIYNEAGLTNKIALRSEIGLETELGKQYFIMAPAVTLEPKWYYNLDNRSAKGKDITSNNGDFVSVRTSYYPDWFIISNDANRNVSNQVAIIPTWGMRRNIGAHFNYEVGAGVGYRIYLGKESDFENEIAINLVLRIGYRF